MKCLQPLSLYIYYLFFSQCLPLATPPNPPHLSCAYPLGRNPEGAPGDVDMWGHVWMSRFRGAWSTLKFYKEYLFGFETLVFATSEILSMHKQLVTHQRESKTWNRIIWPLKKVFFTCLLTIKQLNHQGRCLNELIRLVHVLDCIE